VVDPADLLDSHEVAELLGLASHRAVSTYRGRYGDFPVPIIEKGAGRCVLWLRSDVEQWRASRQGER
jgi:predicted DNA-binding transcriptional regulator AlpA